MSPVISIPQQHDSIVSVKFGEWSASCAYPRHLIGVGISFMPGVVLRPDVYDDTLRIEFSDGLVLFESTVSAMPTQKTDFISLLMEQVLPPGRMLIAEGPAINAFVRLRFIKRIGRCDENE